jgi:hypothetical protein
VAGGGGGGGSVAVASSISRLKGGGSRDSKRTAYRVAQQVSERASWQPVANGGVISHVCLQWLSLLVLSLPVIPFSVLWVVGCWLGWSKVP